MKTPDKPEPEETHSSLRMLGYAFALLVGALLFGAGVLVGNWIWR